MEEGTEIAGVALGQARRRRDQSTPLDAGGNVRRDLGHAALRGTGPGREYSRSLECRGVYSAAARSAGHVLTCT